MKIFKNVLHYLICIVVASAVIIAAFPVSEQIFPSENSFVPEIEVADSASSPSVYPWYNVQKGNVTEIPVEDQKENINEIISFLTMDFADYVTVEKCMYSEVDDMYYAQDINIGINDTLVSVNLAYYFDDAQCYISYIELKTPKSASEEKLSAAMKKYRTYLGDDFIKNGIENPEEVNPLFRLLEYFSELIHQQDITGYEIILMTEFDCYKFITELSGAKSYIYDGLVWFTAGGQEGSFAFAVDPTAEDNVVVFSVNKN